MRSDGPKRRLYASDDSRGQYGAVTALWGAAGDVGGCIRRKMAPAFRGLLETDEYYVRNAGRSLLESNDDPDGADAYIAVGFVWLAFVLSFVSLFWFGYQVRV